MGLQPACCKGVAKEDPDIENVSRVCLLIEDYPCAMDALEICVALQKWAEEYVNIFYKDDGTVFHDVELQDWWSEVRHKGHADRANAEGWPKLIGRAELAHVAMIIM